VITAQYVVNLLTASTEKALVAKINTVMLKKGKTYEIINIYRQGEKVYCFYKSDEVIADDSE